MATKLEETRRKIQIISGKTTMPQHGAQAIDGKKQIREATRDAPGAGGDWTETDRYIVPGLTRGLAILQLFNDHRRVLRLAEIARLLDVPRSSAFRLVYTLESMGFIERSADGHGFRLASKVLSLGFAFLSSVEIVELAREPLEALRSESGLSAHLAVRDGTEIVHLLRVPSLQQFSSTVQVGERRPAHATPMGRMLLCGLSDRELAELYKGRKLTRATKQTPTSLAQLRRQLHEDRARGYVISKGTWIRTGCSVAAAVRDSSGGVVAAINVSGPRDPAIEAELDGRLKDLVLVAAERISQRLGFSG